MAHTKYIELGGNKIRTNGFYIGEFKREQRIILIFYSNGFFCHDYQHCESLNECRQKIKKMQLYIPSSKNNWGGYWIENDSILHLQHFDIMGAGTFVASRGVYEFEAVIQNPDSFHIIISKNLYHKVSGKYNDIFQFYPYNFKPDSTNWIMGKRWYKKGIQRVKKNLNK